MWPNSCMKSSTRNHWEDACAVHAWGLLFRHGRVQGVKCLLEMTSLAQICRILTEVVSAAAAAASSLPDFTDPTARQTGNSFNYNNNSQQTEKNSSGIVIMVMTPWRLFKGKPSSQTAFVGLQRRGRDFGKCKILCSWIVASYWETKHQDPGSATLILTCTFSNSTKSTLVSCQIRQTNSLQSTCRG